MKKSDILPVSSREILNDTLTRPDLPIRGKWSARSFSCYKNKNQFDTHTNTKKQIVYQNKHGGEPSFLFLRIDLRIKKWVHPKNRRWNPPELFPTNNKYRENQNKQSKGQLGSVLKYRRFEQPNRVCILRDLRSHMSDTHHPHTRLWIYQDSKGFFMISIEIIFENPPPSLLIVGDFTFLDSLSHPHDILMDWVSCETSFCCTHDRLSEFMRTCRHITCSIESWDIRLLSRVDHETSFRIFLRIEWINESRDRSRSDSDKDPIESKTFSSRQCDSRDSHHISIYFFDLSREMKDNIWSILRTINPDILSSNNIRPYENMYRLCYLC